MSSGRDMYEYMRRVYLYRQVNILCALFNRIEIYGNSPPSRFARASFYKCSKYLDHHQEAKFDFLRK